jgi:hypothetical protein
MRSLRSLRLFTLTLLLSAAALGPAMAQQPANGWEELPRPAVGKGLMMQPRLLGFGSRCHLVWVGTTSQVPKPEVFHCSISGDSKEWSSARAPFFGLNKSRVRRLALGKARNLLALMFERTLSQGNDAYEVLVSFSGDHGWSWGPLIELDQFVSDVSGGTSVAIEGREAPGRTEFTMAWSRDFGNVRVANTDIKSELRPEGIVVGQHVEGAMKADVGSLGKEGFAVVFNNGLGLATSHARALVGKVEEAVTFLRGRYGLFFTVASSPYGPSRMAVGDAGTIQAFTSNETSWKNDEQVAVLPFDSSGVQAESDMDDDKDLHVAMLVPKDDGYEIWYIGQKDKKWGQPELVTSLPAKLEMRGFDIGVTDDYVFIAASQGYDAKFYRKKQSD